MIPTKGSARGTPSTQTMLAVAAFVVIFVMRAMTVAPMRGAAALLMPVRPTTLTRAAPFSSVSVTLRPTSAA